MKLPIKVISLVRSQERRAAFAAHNGHVAYEFFDAVDGAAIKPQMERLPDLFGPGLPYTAGAVGCALSHLTLWQDVVDTNAPITILEDDAILRHDFEEQAARVLANLDEDWDIVFWGWNFDSVLALNVLPNISSAVMHFNQNQLRASVRNFQSLADTPHVFRLAETYGICAYSISPRGARKFMAQCFPLKKSHFYSPALGREVANIGIDIPMARLYRSVNSLCVLPPLAVSKNERAISTIQTGPERAGAEGA